MSASDARPRDEPVQEDGRGGVGRIVRSLRALTASAHAINPYTIDEHCCADLTLDGDGPEERLRQLTEHLRATEYSPVVLIGEAAGWRGARQTGIAFTAPVHLHEGGMRELSASVVRTSLTGYGFVPQARLFNAYPLHPHKPDQPRSNRVPTEHELDSSRDLLRAVVGDRHVIAVGRKAAHSWQVATGIPVHAVSGAVESAAAVAVRHPSFGGAATFRRELAIAVKHFGLNTGRR